MLVWEYMETRPPSWAKMTMDDKIELLQLQCWESVDLSSLISPLACQSGGAGFLILPSVVWWVCGTFHGP